MMPHYFQRIAIRLSSALLLITLNATAQVFREDFNFLDTRVWNQIDRGSLSATNGVLKLKDCTVFAGNKNWENYRMEFAARAPESADDVRIFASFRYNDDKSRYIFGLRGGNNNDLFLSRSGADNNSQLLAIEPLGFIPQKGVWYKFAIEVEENSIRVFLNDEENDRLRAVDASAPFKKGMVALGGGWSEVEFDYVYVSPLSSYEIHPQARRYNFQDESTDAIDGWIPVGSSRHSKEKGFGWRDDGLQSFKRNVSDDPLYDSLVSFDETGSKILLIDLPNGDYVISLQLGDPEKRSKNRMFFMDELLPAINTVSTPGGCSLLRKSVTVYGGALRIRFELDVPSAVMSLNWMTVETREQAGERAWNKFLLRKKESQSAEKEALRKIQRAEYTPVTIPDIGNSRTDVSLNGNWLFLPDYEVDKSKSPWSSDVNDQTWHVMNVPDFWTPVYNWTYQDHNIARGSKNWVDKEVARCSALTFDYEKTKVGYYKKHIVLPQDMIGKTVQLNTEAIAKSAQIWVNGRAAAVHQGMFAPLTIDITHLIQPGENTIVIQAGDSVRFEVLDETIQGVAVSVEVTAKMLNSLPHGMFFGLNRGIWQDVSLLITDPVTLDDTFFKPQMNSFEMDLSIQNRSKKPMRISAAAQIRDHSSNRLVYDHVRESRIHDLWVEGGSQKKLTLRSEASKHDPFKLWSPEFPNLYTADVFLYTYNEDSTVDLHQPHPDAVKLNFQPLDRPAPSGWTAVDGSVLNPQRGYGWSVPLTAVQRPSKAADDQPGAWWKKIPGMRSRNIEPVSNRLARTLVEIDPSSQAVFTYPLSNGDYVITLQFGDPSRDSLAEAYPGSGETHIEQAIVRDFVPAGNTVTVLKSLTVSEGKLQLTLPALPAPGAGTSLNYVTIERRDQVSQAKWQLGLNHFNLLDNTAYNAGFRTFTVQGDDFLLNGKPYKIRGANHTPNIIRPNDYKLADWFMKTIHDHNIHFTRSHGSPMNHIWLDAADRHGVAVSQEGTWPWLMLYGKNVPEPALTEIWKREWLSLINRHKNHPSILMWTMNNEMKLWTSNDRQPWEILSDAVQAVRALDPTRPVVADSGNCREYLTSRGGAHEGIDDGDVDDHHYYPNWYDNNTFYGIRDGISFATNRTPGRPFISQEFSTGYPDADEGHAVKHYIYEHYNPQTWVGKWASEHHNPAYWLKRHALISKESCEAIRTGYRDSSAGIMIFALCTWFQNLYDVETIKPWPTLKAVAQAWEPVAVCAQLLGRHFYAGSSHTINAIIVNDSPVYETLNHITIDWDIVHNGTVLHSGQKTCSGSLEYYKNKEEQLTFTLPAVLPESKIEAKLVFKLSANGRRISSNTYDITLCDQHYIPASTVKVGYFTQQDNLSPVLSKIGIQPETLSDLNHLNPDKQDILLIDNLTEKPDGYEQLVTYAEAGGTVLLSMNRDLVLHLFPKELRGSTRESREIVTPCAYEKSIFDGINPDELSWFTGTETSVESINKGYTPIACERAYNVNTADHITVLAETMRIHGYVNRAIEKGYHPGLAFDEVFGYPLLEIAVGKGRVIISSMYFHTPDDPIAHRLLYNLLHDVPQDRTRQGH